MGYVNRSRTHLESRVHPFDRPELAALGIEFHQNPRPRQGSHITLKKNGMENGFGCGFCAAETSCHKCGIAFCSPCDYLSLSGPLAPAWERGTRLKSSMSTTLFVVSMQILPFLWMTRFWQVFPIRLPFFLSLKNSYRLVEFLKKSAL